MKMLLACYDVCVWHDVCEHCAIKKLLSIECYSSSSSCLPSMDILWPHSNNAHHPPRAPWL